MERQGNELAGKGLVKTYGRRAVVRGVNLHLASNLIVGLSGPNGQAGAPLKRPLEAIRLLGGTAQDGESGKDGVGGP